MSVDYTILGKEVPVSAVEKELRMLWDEDNANTKASLINFAIYTENTGALVKNSRAVGEITREHSCRAILMELDRFADKKPNIRSWITAHCNLSGGKKAVCCEQLAFKIDAYVPGIVRNVLFAHLDSDLPLVIWWQGPLSESFRESFYSKVDRLIFDSADWSDPAEEYANILAALEISSKLVVQDLAWTRTYQFRIGVAALFDHPLVHAKLPNVQSVKVVSHLKNRTSALQMLSWFSTLSGYQLSNDLVEVSGDVFTMTKPNGGEVKLSVEADDSYEALGLIEIDLGDCLLRVSRELDRPLLRQQIILNGEALVDRHCPADVICDVDLISSQLSRGGKNSLLKRILPQFIEFLDGAVDC